MDPKSSYNKFSSSVAGGNKVQELKDVLKGKKDPTQQTASNDIEQPSMDEHQSFPAADHAQLEEEINALKEKIKVCEEEAAGYKEKNLRIMAEFENFRKRMEREKDENIKFGNEKILKELLPLLDHLEMTLMHATEASDPNTEKNKDPLIEGVTMIVRQFLSLLEKCGLQIVEGEGKNFDPHKQESIGAIETVDFEPGAVVAVHRKGFLLNGRLIRPAMVTVAKAPEAEQLSKEETIH